MKAGQKLVCIEDSNFGERPYPTKGEIVTALKPGIGGLWGSNWVVLKEYQFGSCGREMQFNGECFRPVCDIGDQVEEYIENLMVVEEAEKEFA